MARDFLIAPVGLDRDFRNAGQALIHVIAQRVLVGFGGKLGRIEFGHPGSIERGLAKQSRRREQHQC